MTTPPDPEVRCEGGGLTVGVRRVVVKDAASGAVEATGHNEVALVLGPPAETLLAHGKEAAVLDRQRAELTGQDHSVDQHDGHVALLYMGCDLLDCHRAAGENGPTRVYLLM